MGGQRFLSEGPGPLAVACPKSACDYVTKTAEVRSTAVEDMRRHFKSRHPESFGPKPR